MKSKSLNIFEFRGNKVCAVHSYAFQKVTEQTEKNKMYFLLQVFSEYVWNMMLYAKTNINTS